jgi:hypothetical protein
MLARLAGSHQRLRRRRSLANVSEAMTPRAARTGLNAALRAGLSARALLLLRLSHPWA